jgi:hypothetical protein
MTTRVEQISGVAVEYGKVLLAERPALYPYAAVLLPNGERSMMSLNFDESTPGEAEERLIAGLSEDAADGAIVAASWGYTVDVTSDQGTFPALKVLAEARGEEPHTLYIPYELVPERGPVFGAAVTGPARDAMVFVVGATAQKPKSKTARKPAAKKAAAKSKKASAKKASSRKAAPKKAARKAKARKPTARMAKGKKGRR